MDSIVDILSQGRDREAQASKIYGLVVGIVTNNKDPDKLGRVKVKFPWLDDTVESWWARICYPMGGKERGYWWIPELEDEVLVGFEHGDVRFPYIVGSLYNGMDKPPKADDVTSTFAGTEYDHGAYSCGGRDFNEDGKNDLRFIRSRSGNLLVFDDKDGKEKVTITDKTGSHRIEIFCDKKKVVITSSDGDIELIAEKKVKICCETLETHSRKDTKMNVDGEMDITVQKDQIISVSKGISMTAGDGIDILAGKDLNEQSGQATQIQAGTTGAFTATAKLTCHGKIAEFSADVANTITGTPVMIN
ncbi:hypothetical protein HY251_00520 [bacterium]|nr:hypothetical protein [bacterium]